MSDLPTPLHQPGADFVQPCGALHVLARRQSLVAMAAGQSGFDLLCDHQRDAAGQVQAALVTYLSPFDASFDAAWFGLPVARYQVMPVSTLDPQTLAQDLDPLHYCLHFAWGARDGALVVRPRGSLVRLSAPRAIMLAPTATTLPVTLGQAEWRCYQRMWEQAGLFAYPEALASMRACSDAQRDRHARRAVTRIPATVGVKRGVNQVAFYDIEAAHWHFLPLQVFANLATPG